MAGKELCYLYLLMYSEGGIETPMDSTQNSELFLCADSSQRTKLSAVFSDSLRETGTKKEKFQFVLVFELTQ